MPTVKLFASLRKDAGVKEIFIPGTSIKPVIMELANRYPALTDKLLENGEVRPHVVITINGNPTTNMDAELIEQDQIAVFPPIAGG